MDSGVYASLHPNCQHQVVYSKLNLNIEYPPLYKRLLWDNKNNNTQLFNHATETFNWEKLIENKNVIEQLYLFNKILLNSFHNFISNKNIICNDQGLLWFNNQIRKLIERKTHLLWLMLGWSWIVSGHKRQVKN